MSGIVFKSSSFNNYLYFAVLCCGVLADVSMPRVFSSLCLAVCCAAHVFPVTCFIALT